MWACKPARLLAVVLVLATAGQSRAADTDPDLAYAEKTLQENKAPTGGPALLKFFRDRTLSAADKARLADTVARLGHKSFHVREKASKALVAAGRAAVPFLRPALADSDLEVARRADRCLQIIEQGSDAVLVAAAARVLAARGPRGAPEVLLAYMPSVTDEGVEEAVLSALVAVGLREGQADAAVKAAVTASEPARRVAAAFVLGRGGAAARRAVRPLLRDPDDKVRFQAAAALVRAEDKAAVAPLIGLLGTGPKALAWQAEDILLQIAGEQGPRATLGGADDAERRKCRVAWEAWWKTNRAKVDLAKLNRQETLLGLNVICDLGNGNNGSVWECGRDGKARWEISNINTPVAAEVLRGGRVLIAEYSGGGGVTERDRKGKVLWTQRTNGMVTGCERLRNGNTFISTYSAVMEVTPDNKTVYTINVGAAGGGYRARKLRTGNILYIHGSGNVVECDVKGHEVRKVPVPGGVNTWAAVDLMPNGHFLVGLYAANKVLELDASGKAVWECAVQTPSSVSRLPNGNVLVSSMDACKVIEFNRAGKEVWSQATRGRPFFVYRH
ncbi:MAG TPA: HEAT repeat domain-containing protein [Gemmataceae bacterium]|jgi:HEAT repeat protein|nr:HEAT repeat domain-containing protein [Gemmataceae bacterium]